MNSTGATDDSSNAARTGQELSVEEVEEHIREAEKLHRSLTERLSRTESPHPASRA